MSERVSEEKKNYYAWVILGCVFLIQFIIVGLGGNTFSMYMNPIITQYPSITRTGFSLAFTVISLIGALMNIVYGSVLKKLGVRRIVILGGVMMVIALFLYSIATNVMMLYLGAIASGASSGLLATANCAVMVRTWFSKNHGTLIAIGATASGLGGTIFNPIVGSWIANNTWQFSMRTSCIIVIVTTVALSLLVRNNPAQMGLNPLWSGDTSKHDGDAPPQETEGLTRAEAMRTINFWCICIMFFLIGFLCYSLNGTMAIYSAGLGYDAVTVGSVVSVLYIGLTVGKIPAGWLIDRYGVRSVIIACLLTLIASVALLMQPSLQLNWLFLASGLAGLSGILLSIPLPLLAGEVFGNKDYANILGTLVAVMMMGIAVGNPILNAGYDLTGSYNSVLMIFIPVAIVCIFLCVIGTRKIRM